MTPTYNVFLLWLHSITIGINACNVVMNLAAGKPSIALCNLLVVICFVLLGMSNFQNFWSYRKEMKAYRIEKKRIEMKKLEEAFLADAKLKKEREIKEKFSNF